MSPIGVYDSGFGGLSVLREIRRTMPDVDVVYLGDNGRAPYGGRDTGVILDFAEQCVERLFSEGCRVVVVACHTVSSVALRHLQARYAGPARDRAVLGVTIPAAELAVRESVGGIGFIATSRTVASGTFTAEVAKLANRPVIEAAAPLLAPIVEEGWEDSDVARAAVRRYLEPLSGAQTVMLGCTHYPLLMDAFTDAAGPDIRILDPAPFVAERLAEWFGRHPDFTPWRGGRMRVLSTGNAESFARHGARFFGAPLPDVETITEVGGRLVQRSRAELAGQVVR